MKSDVEALIGQLFITGLHGLEVDSSFEEHYSRCPCGGFVLFGRNVHDPAQLKKLAQALSDLALRYGPDFGPPIVAIDQEGGTLSPLKGLVTSLPGNMGLAATGDPEVARYAGYVTGRDLVSLGINTNFAPVLDLAKEPWNPSVGTRSFGDDPGRVAQFGVEYANGLLDAGVRFVAKHFPGHGSVSEDSHVSLPECRMPKSDLIHGDAVPFAEVAKLPQAAIMAAHVRFTNLDPDRPASLSYPIVSEFLREEMGFDGVVLTDCLEMGGVREIGTVPEAAVMAIEAGCDIVLISHTQELQEAAFEAVRDAVMSGRISLERVERSVARIRRWKRGPVGARASSPWTPAKRLSMDELGERVITFVEGEMLLSWTFGTDALVLVTPAMNRITPAEDSSDVALLLQELEGRGVRCSRVCCSMDPDPQEIQDVISRMEDSWRAMTRGGTAMEVRRVAEAIGPERDAPDSPSADGADAPLPRVALVVRNGGGALGQAALAAALETRCDLLLIGIRDPREVLLVQTALSRPAPAFFTYSTESIALSALARVLAGEASPRGVIPVKM